MKNTSENFKPGVLSALYEDRYEFIVTIDRGPLEQDLDREIDEPIYCYGDSYPISVLYHTDPRAFMRNAMVPDKQLSISFFSVSMFPGHVRNGIVLGNEVGAEKHPSCISTRIAS